MTTPNYVTNPKTARYLRMWKLEAFAESYCEMVRRHMVVLDGIMLTVERDYDDATAKVWAQFATEGDVHDIANREIGFRHEYASSPIWARERVKFILAYLWPPGDPKSE
jgi:hypothetical protein